MRLSAPVRKNGIALHVIQCGRIEIEIFLESDNDLEAHSDKTSRRRKIKHNAPVGIADEQNDAPPRF